MHPTGRSRDRAVLGSFKEAYWSLGYAPRGRSRFAGSGFKCQTPPLPAIPDGVLCSACGYLQQRLEAKLLIPELSTYSSGNYMVG